MGGPETESCHIATYRRNARGPEPVWGSCGQSWHCTFIGSAGTATKPSAHIRRVAATIANASRLPDSCSRSQYLSRSVWSPGARHVNLADLPPSSFPGLSNVHPIPVSAVASSKVYGKRPVGPFRKSIGEMTPGSVHITAWPRYPARPAGEVTIACSGLDWAVHAIVPAQRTETDTARDHRDVMLTLCDSLERPSSHETSFNYFSWRRFSCGRSCGGPAPLRPSCAPRSGRLRSP